MDNKRKFKVEAPRVVKPVPNGTYTGIIEKIDYRDTQYRGDDITYADMSIKVDQLPDTVVVASFPAKTVTPNGSFGKFIGYWHPIKVGEEIDPETILKGQSVSFTVINEPGKSDPKNMYPRVIRDTVMPKNMMNQSGAPATAQPQSQGVPGQ
jgi:hypothetical protein